MSEKNEVKKKSRGRKSEYREEYAEQALKLCLLGATDKEIAEFFSVSEQTLNSWKKKFPQFLESLKKGKAVADANVASRLYSRAIGYDARATKFATNEGGVYRTLPSGYNCRHFLAEEPATWQVA